MTTETKPRVSIAEKAQILRHNGVDVCQWCGPPDDCKYHPIPVLVFVGDEDEGHKAVKILQDAGFTIGVLSREWVYNGRTECDEVVWSLTTN